MDGKHGPDALQPAGTIHPADAVLKSGAIQQAGAGEPAGCGCATCYGKTLVTEDTGLALRGDVVELNGARLIAEIRALEDRKSALAARQARLSVAFDLLQRREQADAGMPAAELGAGVGAQIALARRESPPRAAGSSAWPKPWSPKCRTPSPPWRPGSSTNGAPPSWSGKPRA